MAKIDCSNIFNFMSEWERMAKAEKYRPKHPRFVKGDIDVSKEYVAILQKWSDEHPRQTHKEMFKKICKETDFEKYFPDLLSKNQKCDGIICFASCGSCIECEKYWNEAVD